MKHVVLDARGWKSRSDFNEAVANALGAPDWHGRNLDAWYDSIVTDNINEVRAPYTVAIFGLDSVDPDLREYVEKFIELFAEARSKRPLRVFAISAGLN